jgi:hypothetical protein
MKINKCKILGHKWHPISIQIDFNGQLIKCVICYCKRCKKGFYENANLIDITNAVAFTDEKFFK